VNQSYYTIVIAVAGLILWRRTRNMYRPVKGNGIRILIPALFLIPGIMMILNPQVHAYAWEWISALALGLLLSIPLIWTTGYEIREDQNIYIKKNVSFIFAFVAVLALRFLLRNYLSMIDQQTKTALFMLVATGYIVPWRIVSYIKFRKLFDERSAIAPTA
jgi:membrane protein CcdC involved in cytochrome C biogenesis